jgi:hypothetical protein
MKKTLRTILFLAFSLLLLVGLYTYLGSSTEVPLLSDDLQQDQALDSQLNPDLPEEKLFYISGATDCSPDGTYPESYRQTWNGFEFDLPYCWSVEEVATDMLYFYPNIDSINSVIDGDLLQLYIGPGKLEELSAEDLENDFEKRTLTVNGDSWTFHTNDDLDSDTSKTSRIVGSFAQLNPLVDLEQPTEEELLEETEEVTLLEYEDLTFTIPAGYFFCDGELLSPLSEGIFIQTHNEVEDCDSLLGGDQAPEIYLYSTEPFALETNEYILINKEISGEIKEGNYLLQIYTNNGTHLHDGMQMYRALVTLPNREKAIFISGTAAHAEEAEALIQSMIFTPLIPTQ